MTNSIDTFFDAWAMSDAAARKAAISAAMTDTAIYNDPRTEAPLTGHDAISDYVGAFSANAPGWTAKVVDASTIAGMTRATVAFGGMGPDGSQMQQLGQYFATFDGDKIATLTGFVGTGTPD